MAERSFAIRLAVVDGDKAKATLRDVGEAGNRSLKQIEDASRPASRGLQVLNAATSSVKSSFDGLTGSAGAVGSALSRLGPVGGLAAAGVGAVSIAAVGARRAVEELISQIDALDDQAQRVGLGVERFQAIAVALQGVGVETGKTEQALSRLNDAIGEVRRSGGEAPQQIQKAFADLGISMAQVLDPANDARDVLGLVADGVRRMGDTTQATSATMALFGRGAAELLPLLRQGSTAIDEQEQAARSLGAVLRQDVAEAYSTAGDRLAVLDAAIRVARAEAFAPFIDTTVRVREVVLEAWQAFGALIERADLLATRIGNAGRALEDWATRTARSIADAFRAADAAVSRTIGLPPLSQPQSVGEPPAASTPPVVALSTAALPTPLPSPAAQIVAKPVSRGFGWNIQDEATRKASAAAKAAAAEAARIAKAIEDALDREADAAEKAQRALATLGNERERYIREAVARLPDSATQAQQAEMARRAAASFDLNEQLRLAERYRVAMDALSSEVVAAQAELARFGDDRGATIDAELRRFGAQLTAEQRAAAEALAMAKVAAQERLELLREGKAVIEASLTPAERYGETLRRLDEMLAGGAITPTAYARAFESAERQLHDDEMARLEERRDAIAGLERGWRKYADRATDYATTVERVFDAGVGNMSAALAQFVATGKMNFKDFTGSLLADINRIITQQLIAAALTRAIGGVSGGFGALFGMGASSGSGATAATTGLSTSWDVLHAGGVVGVDRSTKRGLPTEWLAHAPRLHSGLAPDEFPAVLQRGEAVFTQAQLAAMRAPAVSVVVHNHAGARVKVEETARTPTSREVSVIIDRAIAARLADPASRSAQVMGLASPVVQR